MHQLCFHLSPRRRRETISFPFENCFSKFSPIRDCYPLSTPYWFLCLLPVSFHPAGGGAKTCRAPFGLLWVADKTNPAVHAFDMSVLAALHAEWLAPMMGIAWVKMCTEICLISKKVWADSVIADMDLDPCSLSQVEEALISARLYWKPPLRPYLLCS